jgi:hypothetical protein
MNPGVFALIWQQIAVRVADATGQLTAALQDWVGPKFKLCVLAYFLATLLIAAWSADEAAFGRFFRQLFLAGIVYSLISNGTSFDFYVVGLVDGVVNGISSAIAGIFGGPSQVSANIYDTIAVKVFAVGVQTFKNLQWYSPKRGS